MPLWHSSFTGIVVLKQFFDLRWGWLPNLDHGTVVSGAGEADVTNDDSLRRHAPSPETLPGSHVRSNNQKLWYTLINTHLS